MFTESTNFGIVQTMLDGMFFESFDGEGSISYSYDPFKVNVKRRGDFVQVSSNAYSKEIKMQDTFFMKLRGITWEGLVRKAQQEAFEAAYLKHKEENMLDYQVKRLV